MNKKNIEQLDGKYSALINHSCMTNDPEADHGCADDILVELLREMGLNETANAFENVEKWYA